MTREADRYPHESLISRLASVGSSLRAHPRATAGLLLLAAVGLGLVVLSPRDLGVTDLHVGDCLFIRTPDAQPGGNATVGTPADVVDVLLAAGAEQADCGMSHGHEVAGIVALTGALGSPWPGQAALLATASPACTQLFASYLGLAAGATSGTYQVTPIVPDQQRWDDGTRTAVCLLGRIDGHFFSGRAQGSGS